MAFKSPHYQASLIIESKGEAPSVRSAATTLTWSRLYKANGYHIDLACQSQKGLLELRGQLLPPSSSMPQGKVSLYHRSSQESISVPLSTSGTFLLTAKENGPYRLTLDLESASLAIDDLDIT